jgi:hypothetical protein
MPIHPQPPSYDDKLFLNKLIVINCQLNGTYIVFPLFCLTTSYASTV